MGKQDFEVTRISDGLGFGHGNISGHDRPEVGGWRLEDIALSLSSRDKRQRSQAFLSELIYSLSIAGVLTKGDLPVYMVRDKAADEGTPV